MSLDEHAVKFPASRVGRLLGVQILATGSSLPDQRVTNDDLAGLGCDGEWIRQRSGIRERRRLPPSKATSDLAVEAAERCLAAAAVERDEVDLLLVGTYTPDLLLPATACLVQHRLGLRAPAMDLHAACSSFVYALIAGMQFVASRCCRRALVVGADCNTRVVDPRDVRTYPLFGDAGGAVLLGPGEPTQGLRGYAWGADGSGADLLCRPMGGTRRPFDGDPAAEGLQFLQMQGRPVFKWAVRILEQSVAETLDAAGLALADVDLAVFHQANQRIIDAAVAAIGLDANKVYNNLERYGNTSAGSVPLAIDEALRAGRIGRGSRVLVSGFGAGLTWATALLEW